MHKQVACDQTSSPAHLSAQPCNIKLTGQKEKTRADLDTGPVYPGSGARANTDTHLHCTARANLGILNEHYEQRPPRGALVYLRSRRGVRKVGWIPIWDLRTGCLVCRPGFLQVFTTALFLFLNKVLLYRRFSDLLYKVLLV